MPSGTVDGLHGSRHSIRPDNIDKSSIIKKGRISVDKEQISIFHPSDGTRGRHPVASKSCLRVPPEQVWAPHGAVQDKALTGMCYLSCDVGLARCVHSALQRDGMDGETVAGRPAGAMGGTDCLESGGSLPAREEEPRILIFSD